MVVNGNNLLFVNYYFIRHISILIFNIYKLTTHMDHEYGKGRHNRKIDNG